jgi:hypothetical protein
MENFVCKVCERGSMEPRKLFRLSAPVVAIGFVVLIPSVLGILASAGLLLLLWLGVVFYGGTGHEVFSGGFIAAFGVASFVGGLLGWLLVMKKRVIQCSNCGAVVNAS